MSKPMVYLETSFFRYLIGHPSREEPKSSRQKMTGDWWQDSRHKYDLCVSKTVFDEFCEIGDGRISSEEATARLALLQQAELLIQERAILELAALLVMPRGPLPSKAGADALHWAVASYYGCEFVLTWNFKHLNNASIKRRAERIIREYGYESPTLCSPEELEGIDLDGDDV